jgi:predicted transposase YbfD/YdcC
VAAVERITEEIKTGKQRREVALLITSLSPERASPAQVLEVNRRQWGIENRNHWVRDVTFDEDRSQIRTASGPRVMATLRSWSIGLLRLVRGGSIPSALRHYHRYPHLAVALIGL